MKLRTELTPPPLDEGKVRLLAKLADRLDGAALDHWEEDLARFNREAETHLGIETFQGISGAEEHEDWVRRLLYRRSMTPVANLSREEMVEIVSGVVACGADHDFYFELFLVNCRHRSGSDLIYWPNLVPELPQDREPTVEEVAELAMRSSRV